MQSAVTFHDRQDDLDLDVPYLRWKIDLKMQVQAIPYSDAFTDNRELKVKIYFIPQTVLNMPLLFQIAN